MSNPIDKCLNIIRIRHYRKRARRSDATNVRFMRDDCAAAAHDTLQYHPREYAQSMCIECATYALSERKRRSVSIQEVCTHIARRWNADRKQEESN